MQGKQVMNNKDDEIRRGWKIGCKVEIYSDSRKKWLKGQIMKIFNDDEGEWLEIKYAGFSIKDIQRFNEYIRPIQRQKKDKKGKHEKVQKSIHSLQHKNDEKQDDNNNMVRYKQYINKYKDILKSTWNKLLDNKDEVGISIYNAIVFDTTSKRNETLRAQSTGVLFEKTDLKQQSLRFMHMMDVVISKLDEADVFYQKLVEVSRTHSTVYNVKKQNYMEFKRGFMKAIKRQLTMTWCVQYENAWEWFWNFVNSIMSSQVNMVDIAVQKNKNDEKMQELKDMEKMEELKNMEKDEMLLQEKEDEKVEEEKKKDIEMKQLRLLLMLHEKQKKVKLLAKSKGVSLDSLKAIDGEFILWPSMETENVLYFMEDINKSIGSLMDITDRIKTMAQRYNVKLSNDVEVDELVKALDEESVLEELEKRQLMLLDMIKGNMETLEYLAKCEGISMDVIMGKDDEIDYVENDNKISISAFKFVCDCGSKFVGDIASKFSDDIIRCGYCDCYCISNEFIWRCLNDNYVHCDNYYLCADCGDMRIRGKITSLTATQYLAKQKRQNAVYETNMKFGDIFGRLAKTAISVHNEAKQRGVRLEDDNEIDKHLVPLFDDLERKQKDLIERLKDLNVEARSMIEDKDIDVVKESTATFKFLCECGSKFIGDISDKFSRDILRCNICDIECKSNEFIWHCCNVNYIHCDDYNLCVKCGDIQLQERMDINIKSDSFNVYEMKEDENNKINDDNMLCKCGGILIEIETKKCIECNKNMKRNAIHCNKCGYSMNMLCINCEYQQKSMSINMNINDISQQPLQHKYTSSGDTVDDDIIIPVICQCQLQMERIRIFECIHCNLCSDIIDQGTFIYHCSNTNKYHLDDYNLCINCAETQILQYTQQKSTEFVNKNEKENELQIMLKLSYLQSRVTELYKIKLEITSLFELKNHKDFKMQSKKEQATIMEIIDILKDMKNLSISYYQQYAKQNKWAQYLLDTFDNITFHDNQWDAFQ